MHVADSRKRPKKCRLRSISEREQQNQGNYRHFSEIIADDFATAFAVFDFRRKPFCFFFFGKSHLDKVAADFGLPVLARLPIDPAIAESYDNGLMETVNTDALSGAIQAILEEN